MIQPNDETFTDDADELHVPVFGSLTSHNRLPDDYPMLVASIDAGICMPMHGSMKQDPATD